MAEPGSTPRTPDWKAIKVPLDKVGRTRETSDGGLVWTCMACQTVDACVEAGHCLRALPGGQAGFAADPERQWGDPC